MSEYIKKSRVGQAQTWTDVNVFKASGFKMVTGPVYEVLFKIKNP